MIDSKEIYDRYRNDVFKFTYHGPDLEETIESLREVARWAKKCEPQFVGDAGDLLSDALDALPDWLTE